MLNLRSLTGNGKDAGARTPEESLDPSDKTDDTPARPKVGWNAPKSPPPDGITPDQQERITQRVLDRLTTPIENMGAAVEVFSQYMREQRDRESPSATMISLGATPQRARTEGRPYNALVVSGVAGQTLTIQWPGLGTYIKTLAVGWNVLNVPDGTLLSVNNPADCLMIRSYTFLGNPL